MAKKKEIKSSTAKILIFISQVHIGNTYKMKLAEKLQMDYGYLTKIMNEMVNKELIKPQRGLSTNKVFFKLTTKGHETVELAKLVLQERAHNE